MKGLETGKDKVKKICEVLKRETLEPARHEADALIEAAKRHADEILADAKDAAEMMLENTRREIERQKLIFQASLSQACRQTLETLKEKAEHKLFNAELGRLVAGAMQAPEVLAKLITTVIKAIEKDGVEANLSVYIPAAVPAQEVNKLLGQEILNKLKEKGVLLSPIGGGIEVRMIDKNITLDLSDLAIKELVANYIRKDFREMIFA
jgi:V/A-type H+-transporting ATPase subunit E